MAERANALSGRDWLKNSFSIWRNFNRDGNRKSHPASFPVSLVQQILKWHTHNILLPDN